MTEEPRDTYADDVPDVYARCLRCNQLIEEDFIVIHLAEECSGKE